MYSDVRAVVSAHAQADGVPVTSHYPVSGVFGPTRNNQGALVPVLSGDEIRFSANPAPAMSQLNVVGASAETSHAFAPVINGVPLAGGQQCQRRKRRSIWLLGTKPANGSGHASA